MTYGTLVPQSGKPDVSHLRVQNATGTVKSAIDKKCKVQHESSTPLLICANR
jgi:hypothetical protein